MAESYFQSFKGGVKDSDEFIGREEYLDYLEYLSDADDPTHISLYGMPHVGKTSLCEEWIRRIRANGNRLASGRDVIILSKTVMAGTKNRENVYSSVLRVEESARPVNLNVGIPEGYRTGRVSTGDSKVKDAFGLSYMLKCLCETLGNELEAAIERGVLPDNEEVNELLSKADDVAWAKHPDVFEACYTLDELILTLSEMGIRTLLFLDEFERSGQFWPEDEFVAFMDILLDKDLDLFCIVASRAHIDYVVGDYKTHVAPFAPLLLTPFNDSDMDAFCQRLREAGGCELREERAASKRSELLYTCGRNPYLLTIMGSRMMLDSQASPRKIFREVKAAFEEHFEDVVGFMLYEEHRKYKSFSHIVKCYFGTSEDYQDIFETYLSLGYIELYPSTGRYALPEERYIYEDKATNVEYSFTTVCPAFVNYLFTEKLDAVNDVRDLLTGLVHAIRDVTKAEMSAKYGTGVTGWNEAVLSRMVACKRNRNQAPVYYYAFKTPTGKWTLINDSQLANGFNDTRINVSCVANTPALQSRRDWIHSHQNEFIEVTDNSMKYAIKAINDGINLVMPLLDPINITDNGKIIGKYPEVFSRYFGVLGNLSQQSGIDQLDHHMDAIREARNEISHFSRYGLTEEEKEICKRRCRYLLKSIYTYLAEDTSSQPEVFVEQIN